MVRFVSTGISLAWLLGVVGACVGSGEGVPNDDPDPEAVPTSYEEIQTMIFDPVCAASATAAALRPRDYRWSRCARTATWSA